MGLIAECGTPVGWSWELPSVAGEEAGGEAGGKADVLALRSDRSTAYGGASLGLQQRHQFRLAAELDRQRGFRLGADVITGSGAKDDLCGGRFVVVVP